MKLRALQRLCGVTFACLALTGCFGERPAGPAAPSTPTSPAPSPSPSAEPTPTPPGTSWRHDTPESQGMDSRILLEMLEELETQSYGIHGLVIVRNGAVVLNATVFPFSLFPGSRHHVYSCTKSVLSILIGIAIDQGAIQGVDQPALDFFPDRPVANLDARKASMTLENLLTMTTGLDCRDSYLYRWEGMNAMRGSPDWVQFVLDTPMAQEPGSRFEYCNGASLVLSAALQAATGDTAFEYAQEHLFGPLGIADVAWESSPQGVTIGYADLELRPEDLAKIGHLYLQEGTWEGERVVPSAWVRESTRAHVAGTLQAGYGYHWWVDEQGLPMALGYGGQYLILEPEEALVVVFVSDLPEPSFYLPEQLFRRYILRSIRSDGPLPEDPQATTLIDRYLQALEDR